MRRYSILPGLCLFMLLGGCLETASDTQGKPDGRAKAKRVIPSSKQAPEPSDTPSLTVEASDSWLADLHKFLGDGNTVSVEHGWAVTVPGLSISVPAGAKVSYTLSADRGLFKFSDPRPVITVVQYGVKLHPFLNAIEFKTKDSGEATVQQGPFIRRKGFAVAWGYDKSEPPGIVFSDTAGAADEKAELPEIWMFSTDNCGYCDVAVKAIAAAVDLPFRLHVVKEVPPFRPSESSGVHSYPTFWWHATGMQPSAKDLPNTRVSVGWAGLEHLLKKFKDSRKPPATTTVPTTTGVLFGHHWYERNTGRTSIQHLTQDHGLTMEQIRPYIHDQAALCAIHGWKHEGWGVPYDQWRRYTPRHAAEIELVPRKEYEHASPDVMAKTTGSRREHVQIRVFDLRT